MWNYQEFFLNKIAVNQRTKFLALTWHASLANGKLYEHANGVQNFSGR
jgi:hypothetical protein